MKKRYLILIVIVLFIIGVFIPFMKGRTICPTMPPCFEYKLSLFDWIRYRDNLKPVKDRENYPYVNADYNFQLTLPGSWKGFTTETVEMSSNFGSGSILFRVPTTSTIWTDEHGNDGYATVMRIHIFNSSYWDKLQSEEGPKHGFLGRKEDLVYAYSFWQDTPEDWTNGSFTSQEIVSTFKFLQ